jgi:hypothetical protein
MAVDPDAPKVARFISLGGEPYIIRYNSRLPVVVYVPEDAEVRLFSSISCNFEHFEQLCGTLPSGGTASRSKRIFVRMINFLCVRFYEIIHINNV